MAQILNHVIKGRDRRLALLLIHPLGAELSFWDDFIEALGGRVTTIACDLRCSGASFRTGTPPTLADYAGDLDALRRHLAVERVVPVGCAVGSMIAAAHAGSFPSATHALILANPTPSSSPQAQAMLTDRAATVSRDGMTAILPQAMERAFLNQPMDERYWRYYRKFEMQDAHAYALSVLSAAVADASDYLKAVRCPTLMIAGRHDVLLPIANADAVHALLPEAQLLICEPAAHFVPFQQPNYFAERVLHFLSEIPISPER